MTRSPEATTGESSTVLGHGDAERQACVSTSYYQANDPASVAVFREVSSHYIYAAVLSSSAIHRVPALTYLRARLAKHIEVQLELLNGAPGALLAALAIALEDVDSIILGSNGLWDEISPRKALLRLSTIAEAPGRSSLAAQLTNLALHAVTRRMGKLADPRMQSLSSVAALQSLWVGSRANYSGHPRAPVRRKRGDVHGDLAAVVIQLSRPGLAADSHPHSLPAALDSQAIAVPRRITPARRWAFVRAALIDFPKAGKQQAVRRWRETVSAAARAAHLASLQSHAQRQTLAATLEATASAWRQPITSISETTPIAAVSAY
ncbi:hypothetical protein WJX73_000063 [Symbiochloris irregularis]|uniref:Uncharacterized protein n=1 Tax=Symbiochloris irregularis TaxID=706552 RepID=A0AAW1PNN8_9CHLO